MAEISAADGSPVELYARMPTFGEPELIHEAIPAGAEILELGSGAGRMTHRLLELGHAVTAVDNSAEMLARVQGATTIHAEIGGLELGRRFDCVLLASQLINVDDRERATYLETCARHVPDDGVVLIQRYDPEWAADPTPTDVERDGVRIRVLEPHREGRLLTATAEYEVAGQAWRHGPFTATILDDTEMEARLFASGLRLDRWIDERRTWLVASPLPDVSALYVEIPAAESLVAEHRLAWDAVAAAGIPAHVTVLFPFLDPDALDRSVREALALIAARAQPFDVRFERVGRFPEVVWLAPDPVAPFAALTAAIAARWPDHPPYGGAFETVIHHLTVADGAPRETLVALEEHLAAGLPIGQRVVELTLATRRSGTWTVVDQYPLGRIGLHV